MIQNISKVNWRKKKKKKCYLQRDINNIMTLQIEIFTSKIKIKTCYILILIIPQCDIKLLAHFFISKDFYFIFCKEHC